jgi:hypothetical protein
MPLEKVDGLFGITTWKQYGQYVWDNIRYNGHKHLREMQHVTIESAKETHILHADYDKGEEFDNNKCKDLNDTIELVIDKNNIGTTVNSASKRQPEI